MRGSHPLTRGRLILASRSFEGALQTTRTVAQSDEFLPFSPVALSVSWVRGESPSPLKIFALISIRGWTGLCNPGPTGLMNSTFQVPRLRGDPVVTRQVPILCFFLAPPVLDMRKCAGGPAGCVRARLTKALRLAYS